MCSNKYINYFISSCFKLILGDYSPKQKFEFIKVHTQL